MVDEDVARIDDKPFGTVGHGIRPGRAEADERPCDLGGRAREEDAAHAVAGNNRVEENCLLTERVHALHLVGHGPQAGGVKANVVLLQRAVVADNVNAVNAVAGDGVVDK